jgi:hypothetical protein
MKTMQSWHALLAGAVVMLALGSGPAGAATTLPTTDEAQKLVAQAVNARAVTMLFCNALKTNPSAMPVVNYFRTIGFGILTIDGQEFNLTRSGRILLSKLQNDWEHDRRMVDPQQTAWAKMSAAPTGCTRVPLGLYSVGPVTNIRPGDSDQSALADYSFTIAPTSFGDVLVKHNSDPFVDADALVGVPERPTYLSFYLDRAKPLTAQAKFVLDGGVWKVAPVK